MNRILFERAEIAGDVVTFGGVRADHVLDVLHGEVGQILKTGEIDGPVGTGEITAIGRNAAGERTVTVRVTHPDASLGPWVDLILAPPRPRVLKRLLPQLAAMGVGRIMLVGAKKVEKDFWGATLLKEENYRPLLVEGLMQAGTSVLPTVEIWKSLGRFLRERLPALPHTRRIIAHPYTKPSEEGGSRQSVGADHRAARAPLLLAIGPEGGWTEDEVELFEKAGFARHSLGPRILRTDTATIALLATLYSDGGM